MIGWLPPVSFRRHHEGQMTTTGRITVIRFSLCCLLCVPWFADATGQSPPTARDTQMLKRYTKGVVCDPCLLYTSDAADE